MIINKDFYYCYKCEKAYSFDTSKPYSKCCPVCGKEMEFKSNHDCDTELAEKAKNAPPAVGPFRYPFVECPYCHSRDTEKISTMSKVIYAEMMGIFAMNRMGKQWHCNRCHSDF